MLIKVTMILCETSSHVGVCYLCLKKVPDLPRRAELEHSIKTFHIQ